MQFICDPQEVRISQVLCKASFWGHLYHQEINGTSQNNTVIQTMTALSWSSLKWKAWTFFPAVISQDHLPKCFITGLVLHYTHTHTHTHERRIKEVRVTVRATVSRIRSLGNCCLIQMVDGALSQVLLCSTLQVSLSWWNHTLEVCSSRDCSYMLLTRWLSCSELIISVPLLQNIT